MKYLRRFEDLSIEDLKSFLVKDKRNKYKEWILTDYYPDSLGWYKDNFPATVLMTPFYNSEYITPTMILSSRFFDIEFYENDIPMKKPETPEEIELFKDLYFKYSYQAIKDFEERLENEESLKCFIGMDKLDIEIDKGDFKNPRIILKFITEEDDFIILNNWSKRNNVNPLKLQCRSNNYTNKEIKNIIQKLDEKYPWVLQSKKFNL